MKSKADTKLKTLGKIKMVDGVTVIEPPEEAEQEIEEDKTELVIEKVKDIITIKNEEQKEVDEVQHVYDTETERLSKQLSKKVEEENQVRAKEATMLTKPKKVGNCIVASSTSCDDLSKLFDTDK